MIPNTRGTRLYTSMVSSALLAGIATAIVRVVHEPRKPDDVAAEIAVIGAKAIPSSEEHSPKYIAKMALTDHAMTKMYIPRPSTGFKANSSGAFYEAVLDKRKQRTK